MKEFGVVLILLLILQVLLGGCGDDDPTDEWVGTWTLETWNGGDYKEDWRKSIQMDLKIGWSQSAPMEMFDDFVGEIEVIADFTFGNDSRWEFVKAAKVNPASYLKKIENEHPNFAEVINMLEGLSNNLGYVDTGSYIVTDDSFTMMGDSKNEVFTGRMSGIWKRSGSKLNLIGDPSSGLGTMLFSK